MKLVIDERLKHRLVGLSVILALGAIFLPALMKKSSQRLENNFSVNVTLPSKPATPNVVMTDEKEMFKTIKVAKIQIPHAEKQQSSELAKNDFIPSIQVADASAVSVAKVEPASDVAALAKPIELALSNAAKNVVKKQVKLAEKKSAQAVSGTKVKVTKKQDVAKRMSTVSMSNKNVYAVQLASFAQLSNAQALVNKLKSQGHTASYVKTVSKRGVIYKVFTGHSPIKKDVVKLRSQLASGMQLNGFVVNTGVS